VLVAIVVLAAACQTATETTISTPATTVEAPTTTMNSPTTTTATIEATPNAADEQLPDPGQILRMGLLRGMSTDNNWKQTCAGGLDINSLVLDHTRPSLYSIAMPGINVVPDLAADPEPPQPQPFGDGWVVEVSLREDALWSDGEPITAEDVVFTFNMAAEIGLVCIDNYGVAEADSGRVGVLSVVAIDDYTARITFSGEPGLGVWPNGIGVAPIMAEHFWAPHVADARSDADTAAEEYLETSDQISEEDVDRRMSEIYRSTMTETLFAVSGVGDPSGGPMIYAEWTPGLSARNVANPLYYRSGEVIESGGVTYTMGPFIEGQLFLIYDTLERLVSALANGDIDHLMMGRSAPALLNLLETSSNTVTLENPTNGFWYLGFNLRKPPMNDPAFRRALAMMIDRDFLADDLFQNETKPAWTLLPEANLEYFDQEAAAGIASKYRNMDRFERLEKAVAILEEAGYTWDREPFVGIDRGGEALVEAGEGVMLPDGTPAPELEILSPTPGSGLVFFASYAVYIERLLQDLGFDARAQFPNLSSLGGQIWPGVGVAPTFDMYLLGWSLGTPAFPTFHDSFFHSRNLAEVNTGNNSVGYENPALDQLAEALYEVNTSEEAKEILWQLEAIIDQDLPYIVLNELKAIEVVSSRLDLPFNQTLGGLVNLTDFAGVVHIRK
jgi:ABC-type transport system substrate-binding protein